MIGEYKSTDPNFCLTAIASALAIPSSISISTMLVTSLSSAGAVDDSSGTATVLELARQFAAIINTTGQSDRTISFCTWGGEEEGLWGSKSWVQQNADDLAQNLRFYANLDMNHADKDLREDGRLSLFMNYEDDHKHVTQIRHAWTHIQRTNSNHLQTD